MNEQYKIKGTNTKVDLVPYIRQYIKDHPETVILIGSDSQNNKRKTTYATCVGLYTPGKGAHVLANVHQVDRIRDRPTRLLKEVENSINCAEFLRENGLPRAKHIDIDLNPKKEFASSEVYAAGLGWAQGMGYNVRAKSPRLDDEYPSMCYAADSLIK